MSIDIPSKNILVLGNGFDLHHNLKTKYSDYIEFMTQLKKRNEMCANSNKNGVMSLDDLKEDKSKLRSQCLQTYIDKGFSEKTIIKVWTMTNNNFVQYFMSYNVMAVWKKIILFMHFFGHSLDATDREKLIYLFNIASRIKIYYYDEDDHEEKIEKVIELLGKQNALIGMHDKRIDFIQIEKTEKEMIDEKRERERPFINMFNIFEEMNREKEEEQKEKEEMEKIFKQLPKDFFQT